MLTLAWWRQRGLAALQDTLHSFEHRTFRSAVFIFVSMYLLQSVAIWDFGTFLFGQLTGLADVSLARFLPESSQATSRLPTVLISDEAYERDFGQRSPLDRHRVAVLIRDLAARAPQATLVVDLDLSPRLDALENQDELDRQMAALGRRLVLILPDKVTTPEAAWLKVEWLQRQCAAGNRFAPPDLKVRYGSIDTGFNTNGSLAGLFSAGIKSIPSETCAIAAGLSQETAPFFWQAIAQPDADSARTRRILLRNEYFQAGPVMALASVNQVTELKHLADVDYVVLGGGWGPDDRFVTVAGERYGSEVHAAQIYSALQPISPAHPFFGVVLSLLLIKWGFEPACRQTLVRHFEYSAQHQRLRTDFSIPLKRRGHSGRHFFLSMVYLVGFLGMLLLLLLAMLAINAGFRLLFSYDLGVNAMMPGVFLWLFFNTPRFAQEATACKSEKCSPECERKAGEILANTARGLYATLIADLAAISRFRVVVVKSRPGAVLPYRVNRKALADALGGTISFAFFVVYLTWLALEQLFESTYAFFFGEIS